MAEVLRALLQMPPTPPSAPRGQDLLPGQVVLPTNRHPCPGGPPGGRSCSRAPAPVGSTAAGGETEAAAPVPVCLWRGQGWAVAVISVEVAPKTATGLPARSPTLSRPPPSTDASGARCTAGGRACDVDSGWKGGKRQGQAQLPNGQALLGCSSGRGRGRGSSGGCGPGTAHWEAAPYRRAACAPALRADYLTTVPAAPVPLGKQSFLVAQRGFSRSPRAGR